jgi:hypothetical protein
MKKIANKNHLEGYLYEYELEKRTTGENSKNPGQDYIRGSVSIATDDECLNIVKHHFVFVPPVFKKSGKTNETYTTLLNIAEGKIKSVMSDGKENAAIVRVDGSIGLNEFYSDKNGSEELISVVRSEGGFIHVSNTLSAEAKDRNRFDCDMVITGYRFKEGDPEREIPDKGFIKGCIFDDYRKTMMPVEFALYNPQAMDYFEGLEVSGSNPVFTEVKGSQISTTVVRKIEEESAFGEAMVREVKSTNRDWVVTWAKPDVYDWDSDDTITAEEFKKCIEERNMHLAELKQQFESRKSSSNAGAFAANAEVKDEEFKF